MPIAARGIDGERSVDMRRNAQRKTKGGNHQIAQWKNDVLSNRKRAEVYFTRSPNASTNLKMRLRQPAEGHVPARKNRIRMKTAVEKETALFIFSSALFLSRLSMTHVKKAFVWYGLAVARCQRDRYEPEERRALSELFIAPLARSCELSSGDGKAVLFLESPRRSRCRCSSFCSVRKKS